MKKVSLLVLILLTIIIVYGILSKKEKEPKGLIPRFEINWEMGNKERLLKFRKSNLPLFSSGSLVTRKSYLYVTGLGPSPIQILKINPDGNLIPKFSFGKEGRNLGEFDSPSGLAIQGNYLYVADFANDRIQILKINPDGNLIPKFSFGKEGRNLGEFLFGSMSLAVKRNNLYVADWGNSRIQVLEIRY
jgi:6-phosphogluconolactonase (cycloisomerase 2 family)